jgi:hypothetical protein
MLEGFEGAGATEGNSSGPDMRAYLTSRYDNVNFETSANGSPRVGAGWGFGKSLGWGDDGNGELNKFEKLLDTPLSTIYVGFAVKTFDQFNRESADLLKMRDSGNNREVINCRFQHGRSIMFFKETFSLVPFQAVNVLRNEAWQYVEFKFTFNATTGEIVVRVNGVEVLNETGLDLDSFGSTTVDQIQFYGAEGTAASNTNEQWFIDDIYIDDSQFQGPIKIEGLLPTAEGATIDFTPNTGTDNSANVDDNPRDDDTTYNDSADTPSNKDLFTTEDLSNITGGIIGVQVTSIAKLDSAGSIGLQSIVAEGTPTQGTGSVVEITSTTDYFAVQHIFETNPDTASAWSAAEVDGMEIGYEID